MKTHDGPPLDEPLSPDELPLVLPLPLLLPAPLDDAPLDEPLPTPSVRPPQASTSAATRTEEARTGFHMTLLRSEEPCLARALDADDGRRRRAGARYEVQRRHGGLV